MVEGIVVLGRSGRGSRSTSRCRFRLGGDPLVNDFCRVVRLCRRAGSTPADRPAPQSLPFPWRAERSVPRCSARFILFDKGLGGAPRAATADQPRISSLSIRWPRGAASRVLRVVAERSLFPVCPCGVLASPSGVMPTPGGITTIATASPPRTERSWDYRPEYCALFTKRTSSEPASRDRSRLATPWAGTCFRSPRPRSSVRT